VTQAQAGLGTLVAKDEEKRPTGGFHFVQSRAEEFVITLSSTQEICKNLAIVFTHFPRISLDIFF